MIRKTTYLLLAILCMLILQCRQGISGENMRMDHSMLEAATSSDSFDLIKLKYLLKEGADINARTPEGLSAIHLAAKTNSNPQAIEILLNYGCDLSARAESINITADGPLAGTPLYYALCYNPNFEVIETILNNLPQQEYPVYALVSLAARNPNAEVVTNLYKCLLNELLLKSAVNPNTAVIADFIRQGADIDAAPNNRRTTPLYVAVEANNSSGVRYLLRAGADINLKYSHKLPLLLTATTSKSSAETAKIINQLIMYGCSIDAIDKRGNTALHLAVKQATSLYHKEYAAYPLSVIKELLNLGADLSARNNSGYTPLEYAQKHLKTLSGNDNLASEVIRILDQAENEQQQQLSQRQAMLRTKVAKTP